MTYIGKLNACTAGLLFCYAIEASPKDYMNTQNDKRARPIIGILIGSSILQGTSTDHYRVSILRGIQSAARIRQCDLVVGWGIRPVPDMDHIYPIWPIVSPKSDFVPVGPWNMDGLIVFNPLGSEERSLYLQKLIAEGYPILFIATGEQGSLIGVDNSTGIRQAMAHLAEHGHRHIAFISGIPTDTGDSLTRLQAYHAAVAEYDLEADPRLVAWGWHYIEGGYKAMQGLLESGVEFTAVMASNDNSAVGAMQAIREAGLRIPADIAIIGFDDEPVAVAQMPPLSSIHVPLGMIGEQALVTMLDHLTNQTPMEPIRIRTRLVRRQSCGCIPDVISSTFERTLRAHSTSVGRDRKRTNLPEQKQQLVGEMLNVLPAELRFPGGDEIRDACTFLVEAFYKSLDQMTPTYFQDELMNLIHELEMADRSIEPWQEMISVLRNKMTLLPLKWKRLEIRHFAEDLLHQARVTVGESVQRQESRHEYERSVNARSLNQLTSSLSAVLSERQAIELMNSHLAKVGIRHAKVMSFEADQDDSVRWSLVINADASLPPQRFLSRQFPPLGLYPAEELLNIILLPIVFENEVFGYAAFEASDLATCAVIAIQLAATFKVSRLHAEVVELSLTDALTGLQNRRYFELFLKNEISRSRRFSRSLAVILLDVDHFKEYNDSFGHPAGDEALQQVAKCLSKVRRSADIVARLGGDEFVFILPETDINGAMEVSHRIHAAVSELSGLKRPLSVSMGMAALGGIELDSERLIKQADMALYETKRTGRKQGYNHNS